MTTPVNSNTPLWARILRICLSSSAAAFVMSAACNAPTGAVPEIHAHRGGGALKPENSLLAIRYSVSDVGVNAVEFDVNQTSDKGLVINHNLRINPAICINADGSPITDPPLIAEITLSQARAYDCGTPTGQPSGTPLPLLSEVFETVNQISNPPIQSRFDMHVKWNRTSISPDDYVALLLKTINAENVLGQVNLLTSDPEILDAAFRAEPRLPLYFIVPGITPDVMRTATQTHVAALLPADLSFSATDVDTLHLQGYKVIPFTVNSPTRWPILMGMGVDGIITDDPLSLRNLIYPPSPQ